MGTENDGEREDDREHTLFDRGPGRLVPESFRFWGDETELAVEFATGGAAADLHPPPNEMEFSGERSESAATTG